MCCCFLRARERCCCCCCMLHADDADDTCVHEECLCPNGGLGVDLTDTLSRPGGVNSSTEATTPNRYGVVVGSTATRAAIGDHKGGLGRVPGGWCGGKPADLVDQTDEVRSGQLHTSTPAFYGDSCEAGATGRAAGPSGGRDWGCGQQTRPRAVGTLSRKWLGFCVSSPLSPLSAARALCSIRPNQTHLATACLRSPRRWYYTAFMTVQRRLYKPIPEPVKGYQASRIRGRPC
ncbi:unnamed protein product [Arctogadus glacialis]